ncbi:MAG: hypothetical protein GY839_12640, partial [candidate division Zixibacteria bacterium]|nr:hypothetical protein [candidate division Zixibacteria bacterium]
LMLILDTDSYGSETSWDVINHNDPADTIASGGPYASLSHFEEQICMGTADCIDVYIYDAYGDGGPDYDILLNDVSLFSGTIAGFGEAFMNIGNGCVTIVGACCDDVTGICVDDVAEDDCPIENRWVAETLCADIYPPCGVPLGSCCYDEGILPACAINTQAECDVLGGTWTEDGTCADCPMCVDADYDNGQPFDDYGSPASQYINDFPISAEAADDFFLPGLGLTQVMMVTAWTTHWNGPANPSYYDHVNVTIYADYEFGTPDTSWPAGYMGDDGVHVEFEAGGVVFTEDVTDFTYWQLPRDCTGDLWQLNLALSNCILDLGTKYWIVVQPDMSFSGVGQCAFALSDMNTGDAAKTNFPYLGTPAWTEFDGNAGVCDTLAPEGTLTDMAFCLDIQEPECELIDPPWESTDVFMDNLNDSYAPPGDPRGSQWHELWPNYCTNWDLTSWLDNGDSTLSTGDYVDFTAAAASCYTLEVVYIGPTVILTNIMAPGDTIYMDQLQVDQADPFPPVTDVLLSQWKGIWPVQAQCLCDPCEHPDGPLACPCNWMVTGWEDNGNGVLDSCDYIEMTYCDMLGGETVIEIFHVEGIAIDIVLRKIPTINQIQDSLTVVGIGDDCWPSPYDGEPVAVNGTVVAITQTDSLHPYPNYFLQDCATEDFNGIYVYDDAHGDMALGDHVTVSGEIDEYYGLTELKNVTGLITIPDADEPLCTLVVTDSDELWECDPTAADGENLEGVLVMLENVTVSSTASGGRAWVRTAGATDSVEVDDDLYKYGTDQPEPWEVGATYDYIVGMVQYTYGNYELWPRFAADVAELGYQYLPGDANMGFGTTGLWPPRVVGGDVTYLVNYFIYETHTPGCFIDYGDSLFFMSGDANGDCQVIGSDVTKLVNHFRFELPDSVKEIVPCSLYTTVWPDTAVIPEVQPDGWPPCDHILNPPPASTPKVIPNGLIK